MYFFISAMSGRTSAAFVFKLTLFATRRAEMSNTSSKTTNPLARRVPPDCTMSKMTSASPVSGASSMEPLSLMISTSSPREKNSFFAVLTYLVATRRCGEESAAFFSGKPARHSLHFSNFKSSISYRSAPASSRVSLPTMPISAMPYST